MADGVENLSAALTSVSSSEETSDHASASITDTEGTSQSFERDALMKTSSPTNIKVQEDSGHEYAVSAADVNVSSPEVELQVKGESAEGDEQRPAGISETEIQVDTKDAEREKATSEIKVESTEGDEQKPTVSGTSETEIQADTKDAEREKATSENKVESTEGDEQKPTVSGTSETEIQVDTKETVVADSKVKGESADGDEQKPTGSGIPESEIQVDTKDTEEADSEMQGAVGEESDGSENDPDEEPMECDPYFYTKLDEFTSEIFKIELKNLPNPKKIGYKHFKNMIKSRLNVTPVKSKLVPRTNHAYVTFRNEDERQLALRSLSGFKWKGKILIAKLAQPVRDPFIVQRSEGEARKRAIEEAASANAKRAKIDGIDEEEALALSVRLNHVITPLWNQPYVQQIAGKHRVMVDVLKKLTKRLAHTMISKDNWVKQESAKRNGLCCELLDCVESPIVDGYRNKCEFTISEGPDKEKTIGFRLGSYREGYSGVVDPSECIHISPLSKVIVQAFQTCIRQSQLVTYDLCFHTGNWQTLTVRTTEKDESMAILQFSPQDMKPSEIELERDRIVKFFTEGDGKDVRPTSLYLHINNTRAIGGRADAPYTHVLGDKYVYEYLGGLKCRISPSSFFQVNTQAAEKLFAIVKDLCGEDLHESTVIDICCGTGTIGLSLAKSARRLIGAEIIGCAVEDANATATLNEITNSKFVLGKAEEVMEDVFKSIPRKTKVIGILDPPRAGIHSSVIQSIRKCKKMDRLVYVACNASAAFDNFLELCRPTSKRNKTAPFKLMKAIPVDLFPHTKHCELVMLFIRDTSALDADQFYKWYY